MNKKILNYIIFIIIASILLYFARHNYRDFNINKAISACVLAKKQNTTNFDRDLVKKQCEEDIRKIVEPFALSEKSQKQAFNLIQSIYKILIEKDANLIEINPLILTKDNNLLCLDAKISFDDNALYRHPDIVSLKDLNEEDPIETEASKQGLSYVKLDGKIGCMVNGAGLAMATMDIIKLYGGEPANFLDVGGVANAETVANGFKIIISDKNVESVLINIFGGIVRCDRVAQGVIDAMKHIVRITMREPDSWIYSVSTPYCCSKYQIIM